MNRPLPSSSKEPTRESTGSSTKEARRDLKSSPDTRVRVDLGDRSYDIVIAADLIDRAGDLLVPLVGQGRAVVVTDRNVAEHHLLRLSASLDATDIEHRSIVLEPGEHTKDFAHFEELANLLLDAEVERGDLVIALGGGVVGDLAGFAASVFRRGIDFVQIPTTLLAQVDSSVGGKTGINTPHGKNLIGSFHQPSIVIADWKVLDTLPPRELRAGYAEIVKYGLLGDAEFFSWLETNGRAVLEGSGEARGLAITRSCKSKSEIVAADEREAGPRALLNLGHTFAHAIEAEVGYGANVLHGEAVAVGLVLAFALSSHLGLCPDEDTERVRNHLAGLGLPTTLSALGVGNLKTERLIKRMRQDKKVKDGIPAFVLVGGIGTAYIDSDVNLVEVRKVLDATWTA